MNEATAMNPWVRRAIYALALAAAPVNLFIIQFLAWAWTHHAEDTSTQDAIWQIALIILAVVSIGAVVAMIMRRTRIALSLSLLLLAPPVWIVLTFLFGST